MANTSTVCLLIRDLSFFPVSEFPIPERIYFSRIETNLGDQSVVWSNLHETNGGVAIAQLNLRGPGLVSLC